MTVPVVIVRVPSITVRIEMARTSLVRTMPNVLLGPLIVHQNISTVKRIDSRRKGKRPTGTSEDIAPRSEDYFALVRTLGYSEKIQRLFTLRLITGLS